MLDKDTNTKIIGFERGTLLNHCRGDYQADLVYGDARWSGGDLKGKARKYAASYAQSRSNLLDRFKEEEDCFIYMGYHPDNGLKQTIISNTEIRPSLLDETFREWWVERG